MGAVDVIGEGVNLVVVGEPVHYAAAFAFAGPRTHRDLDCHIGIEGEIGIIQKIDADLIADLAVATAPGNLNQAAPAVAKAVAGLRIADILATIIDLVGQLFFVVQIRLGFLDGPESRGPNLHQAAGCFVVERLGLDGEATRFMPDLGQEVAQPHGIGVDAVFGERLISATRQTLDVFVHGIGRKPSQGLGRQLDATRHNWRRWRWRWRWCLRCCDWCLGC